ncbi:hypothetical protein [Pseudoxanthomonas sp. 10H]|uniref:hypothetical protein n=1 Tax=Pseudoxanthomonas sp. 10H TaxID=3242729 RepID=UPI003558DDD5
MNIFLILLMTVLAGWAILATVLAVAWAGRLRRTRQDHEDAQALNARYRAAVRRLEEHAAASLARFDALHREYLELKRSSEAGGREPAEPPLPLVVIDSLDLSGEIGSLFEHVARVAVAVRTHSAYTRGHHGLESPHARYDLLWLADCLHTFDRVGKALAGGSQRALAAACEELLSMYDAYLKDGSGYDSRASFQRLATQVPLGGVSDAMRAIVMKTAPAPDGAGSRPVPAVAAGATA